MNYDVVNEGNDFIVKKWRDPEADARAARTQPRAKTPVKSPEELAHEYMMEQADREREEDNRIRDRNDAYDRAMRGL